MNEAQGATIGPPELVRHNVKIVHKLFANVRNFALLLTMQVNAPN